MPAPSKTTDGSFVRGTSCSPRELKLCALLLVGVALTACGEGKEPPPDPQAKKHPLTPEPWPAKNDHKKKAAALAQQVLDRHAQARTALLDESKKLGIPLKESALGLDLTKTEAQAKEALDKALDTAAKNPDPQARNQEATAAVKDYERTLGEASVAGFRQIASDPKPYIDAEVGAGDGSGGTGSGGSEGQDGPADAGGKKGPRKPNALEQLAPLAVAGGCIALIGEPTTCMMVAKILAGFVGSGDAVAAVTKVAERWGDISEGNCDLQCWTEIGQDTGVIDAVSNELQRTNPKLKKRIERTHETATCVVNESRRAKDPLALASAVAARCKLVGDRGEAAISYLTKCSESPTAAQESCYLRAAACVVIDEKSKVTWRCDKDGATK